MVPAAFSDGMKSRGPLGRTWWVIPPRYLGPPFLFTLLLVGVAVSFAAAATLYIAIPCSLTCPPEAQRAQLAILIPLWWPMLLAGHHLAQWAIALAFVWQFVLAVATSRLGIALWLRYG